MIAGSEKESRSIMMDAAIRSVARYGFEGFTTKKWAAETGVAEGSLYYHFKSKDELLNETFFYIEQEILELCQDDFKEIESSEDLKGKADRMLERYYRFLLDNPEKTLFYFRFRTSPRFNNEIRDRRSVYTGDFQKKLFSCCQEAKGEEEGLILQSYVLDTTVSLAYRTIMGQLSDTEESTRKIIDLVLGGVRTVIAI